jgi:hypothetical protein
MQDYMLARHEEAKASTEELDPELGMGRAVKKSAKSAFGIPFVWYCCGTEAAVKNKHNNKNSGL